MEKKQIIEETLLSSSSSFALLFFFQAPSSTLFRSKDEVMVDVVRKGDSCIWMLGKYGILKDGGGDVRGNKNEFLVNLGGKSWYLLKSLREVFIWETKKGKTCSC